MPSSSHNVKASASPNLHAFAKALCLASSHNAGMAGEKNYLKAWREFRQLSQEALAEKVGTTGSVISMLENGNRGLSDKWLRKLAPVLETTPGHLLDHHPEDMDADIHDIWAKIDPSDREQAARILRTFARTGAKG